MRIWYFHPPLFALLTFIKNQVFRFRWHRNYIPHVVITFEIMLLFPMVISLNKVPDHCGSDSCGFLVGIVTFRIVLIKSDGAQFFIQSCIPAYLTCFLAGQSERLRLFTTRASDDFMAVMSKLIRSASRMMGSISGRYCLKCPSL
jgi:hypothetical protein